MPPAPRAKWFSWTSAIAVGVAVGAGAFVYYHHVLDPPKRPNESREDEKDASRKISVVASPSSGPVSPGASSAVGAGTPQRTPNTGSPSTQSPRLSKKERQKLAVSRAQSELLGSGHFGEAADESCSDVEIPTDAGALRVRFERAAGNVERIVGKMTSADKLLVYGLYKQATTGKCALPKPRLLEGMTKHAKWVAWSELGDLPKASAMTEYVLLVEKLCGVTMPTSSAGKGNSEEGTYVRGDALPEDVEEDDLKEEDMEEEEDSEDTEGEFGMGGPVFSRPELPFDTPVGGDGTNGDDSETPLRRAARFGDAVAVRRIFANATEAGVPFFFDHRDDEGRTALHWCADGGHWECVDVLLTAVEQVMVNSASHELTLVKFVNATDDEGQTALHYAATVESGKTCGVLLRWGADLTLKDADGETPAELGARELAESADVELEARAT